MFRIDVASAAVALPAPAVAGTQGYFSNGNPATSVPSTVVDQDWLNSVQEELVAIAVSQGAALSKTTRNQCLVAIQAMIATGASSSAIQAQAPNYAVAGGTANAITAAFAPVIAAHIVGAPLRVKITLANTGAVTFSPGPAPVSLVTPQGAALIQGDLVVGMIAEVVYDGAAYQLKNYRAQAATGAETKAGALANKAVTPAGLLGSFFESAEINIVTATDTAVAHGLTAPCKRVQAWLRCKTAELGYAVGDEYLIVPNQDTGVHGVATYISGANVGAVVCTVGNIDIYRRSAPIGDSVAITQANWKIVLRAASF
jgi:hypothetical protein